MTPTRHLVRVPAEVALVMLLLGSLLSFGLGQEARAVVLRLPLVPRLSDVASRQTTGALGVPIPAMPPAHRAAPRRVGTHSVRFLTTRKVTAHVTFAAPTNQCAPGYTMVENSQTTHDTPDGTVYSSILICVSAGAGDMPGSAGPVDAPPVDAPPVNAPDMDAPGMGIPSAGMPGYADEFSRNAGLRSYHRGGWSLPGERTPLSPWTYDGGAGRYAPVWQVDSPGVGNGVEFDHRDSDRWRAWQSDVAMDPMSVAMPGNVNTAYSSGQALVPCGGDQIAFQP